MANFNTHIIGAAVAAGIGATAAAASGVVPPSELPTLFLAGVAGGVGPDVDLDKGLPLNGLFGVVGLGLATAVVLTPYPLSLMARAALWPFVFAGVAWGGRWLFREYSSHRGIWHSVLAGALFASVLIAVLGGPLGKSPVAAWLSGAFLLGGYLVHLFLDEVYSVDVHDRRIKKSFGTALKLYDYRNPRNSLIMAAAVVVALAFAPSPKPLIHALHVAQGESPYWAAQINP